MILSTMKLVSLFVTLYLASGQEDDPTDLRRRLSNDNLSAMFAIGVQGSSTCPSGYSDVVTADECRKAGKAVGLGDKAFSTKKSKFDECMAAAAATRTATFNPENMEIGCKFSKLVSYEGECVAKCAAYFGIDLDCCKCTGECHACECNHCSSFCEAYHPKGIEFLGCYANEGSDRVNGHVDILTYEDCEARAGGGFFGMEYPQVSKAANYAQCLMLPGGLPSMKKVNSKICRRERDGRWRLLGDSNRLAVYGPSGARTAQVPSFCSYSENEGVYFNDNPNMPGMEQYTPICKRKQQAPKVQIRTRGTCPVFSGIFNSIEGGKSPVAVDQTTTIDAEACAEFCTATEHCNTWSYNINSRLCYARKYWKSTNLQRLENPQWKYGLRCPKVEEAFYEHNYQYWETPIPASNPRLGNVITWPIPRELVMDHDVKSESGFSSMDGGVVDICSQACSRGHPGCKSWSYSIANRECYTFLKYMPGRKKAKGYISGLPKRQPLKDLELKNFFEPRDCHEWESCEWGLSNDCSSGRHFIERRTCGFFSTQALCSTSRTGNGGCGCGRACRVGVPPQGHDGFVRFCEHGKDLGKCCDQAAQRAIDLNETLGCPHDATLSSIEIVGDCKVELYRRRPNRGTPERVYTIVGDGQYNAGPATFPNDAITFARITCNN